jgi:AraC-like DNA-binding protein
MWLKQNGGNMSAANLLSLVPAGSLHRVHGERTVALPGATVDILTARKIELQCWELNRLSDPYWRLYWPLEEGGVVEIEGKYTSMVPGKMYLIPPHTSFSTQTLKPFSKWYVHFNLGVAGDRAAPGIYSMEVQAGDEAALSALVAQSETEEAPFSWVAVILVAGAAGRLPEGIWQHQRLDPRLRSALDFMSAHLAVKLVAEQIAKYAGLSVRNLNHLFRQELQRPPMRVLLDYRLDHACALLRHSEASIDEIAEQCGLVNRHYLSRMMRQYRNTSPATYRRESI